MRHVFESFELLEQERQVRVGGLQVPVGGRAFDVLALLVRHHDRVVSKAELLDHVWPEQAVEESNLQVQISALRRRLGQHTIATVPGRGYRLAQTPVGKAPRAPADMGGPIPAPLGSPPPDDAEWSGTLPRRGNLPLALPALIGREQDLAPLRALLAAQRLVSVVAAGGVGKTHLARVLAAELAHGSGALAPDGVWCVELAALQDGGLVPAEVVRVLGHQVPDQRSPTVLLQTLLRRQRALLLLDNCEHLAPAVASLVGQLLGSAPHLRVLVTSQVPLKLPGERLYRLQPLTLPHDTALDAVRTSPAVQMLVDRIQAVWPAFQLHEANAQRLAALAERLDGIPLALEFAAARVPVLGLDALLGSLDERLRLLGGGPRGLARHQTLRAALEFSHALLSAEEQAVYRRIGVFAGSFAAESACEVVADDALDRWAVLDHLGALVDKSLLLTDAGEPPRLRLLETTRAHALERLDAAGETDRLRARHARATGALVAQAAEDYWSVSDATLRERYGPEQANLRVALDWALQHDPALAIEMAGNACALWREAWSQQPEGARWCEAAVALLDADTPPKAAGRLLYCQGWMLIWSQQQRGRAAAARAAPLLRQAGDDATLAMTLLLLIPGTTRPDAAQRAHIDEVRLLQARLRAPRAEAACRSALARFAMGEQRWADATAHYQAARAVLQRVGSVQWEAVLSWTQAGIALAQGHVADAVPLLQTTARRLLAEPVHSVFAAFALGSLSTAFVMQGQPEKAREALQRAEPLILQFDLGYRYAGTAAALAAAEGRLELAAELLGFAEAEAQRSGVDAVEPAEIAVTARTRSAVEAGLTPADRGAAAHRGARWTVDEAYARVLQATSTTGSSGS